MRFWESFLGFDPNRQSAFPGQQPEEEVELMTVFHWITLVPYFTTIIIGIFLILLLFWIMDLSSAISPEINILLLTVLIALFIHFICFRLYNFFLKVIIITNVRIIHICHTVFLSREREAMPMNHIQEFRYIQHGIFPRLFHYGNLLIFGASTDVEYIFHHVPHVNHVHHLLGELHQKVLKTFPGMTGI